MGADEELGHVILRVDDDFKPGLSGERVWAKELGGDLWEIRNTPWHTCDVAFGDVVLAKSDASDHWPTVVKVVRPSGHKTLHLYFGNQISTEKRDSILKKLRDFKASYEGADGRFYSLDLEPPGDFDGLTSFLEEMEREDVLSYRTIVRGKSNA